MRSLLVCGLASGLFLSVGPTPTPAAEDKAAMRGKTGLARAMFAAGPFHPAEDYHQDYYRKGPVRDKFFRYNSGRDQFLN